MGYTSGDQVRQVMTAEWPLADEVTDQPLTLSGTGFVRFFGGAVLEGSLRVKAIRQAQQIRAIHTFSSDVVSVASVPLAPGSVVVARDSSLGGIHLENTDYTVEYGAALIMRRPGGSIGAGQAVTVWHVPYHLYTAGEDYDVHLGSGELRRVVSGEIVSGQTIYLDYRPQRPRLTDLMVDAAVTEANALVERDVDPEREFGSDPVLAAAATSLAIEIVCRGAACRELAAGQRDDRTATAWLKLTSEYAARAERLLRSFRPPVIGPATPAIS